VERARRHGGRGGTTALTDILANQATDPTLLAEIYDIEHDPITEDLAFYREWARRCPGAIVDLGCGSGRLFEALLDGGATRVLGVDGSASLIERAKGRIATSPTLRAARDDGRIELMVGDVRLVRRPERFALAVLAGVLAHLDGPEETVQALASASRLLEPDGALIIDALGPGVLPRHDLPMSVDWERSHGNRHIVRRSRLDLREGPEGLHVAYATLTDVAESDGTIARLPASFRLWYPSPAALVALAIDAGLTVDATYGSHDLDPLDGDSERCIIVARQMTLDPRMG